MSLTNFEEITIDITDEEKNILVPMLIKGFESRTKENPIKAFDIVQGMNDALLRKDIKIKFTDVRMRKCVNYIRSNSMIPIISTHHGYYVSNDKKEIQAQTDSLLQRAQSIINSAKGLQKFLV